MHRIALRTPALFPKPHVKNTLRIPIYQLDAFASAPFKGNLLGGKCRHSPHATSMALHGRGTGLEAPGRIAARRAQSPHIMVAVREGDTLPHRQPGRRLPTRRVAAQASHSASHCLSGQHRPSHRLCVAGLGRALLLSPARA